MRNNQNKTLFWAFIFILGGSVLLMENLDMVNLPFSIWDFVSWKLIPLIIGINALLRKDYVGGVIALSIATVFYIPEFLTDAEKAQYVKLWPLLFVGVGIAILARYMFPKKYEEYCGTASVTDTDSLNESYIMAGSSKKFVSQNFKGGKVTCIMGGSEVNFTESDLQNNALLDVFILMGGMEMRIPKDWNVKIEAFPFMGGIEDTITKFPEGTVNSSKLFIIKGFIMMGGIEIVRV